MAKDAVQQEEAAAVVRAMGETVRAKTRGGAATDREDREAGRRRPPAQAKMM